MKLLRRILVATDFSQASEEALRVALFLAKNFDSEIILLHVVPKIKDSPLNLSELKEAVTKHLEAVGQEVEQAGVSVSNTLVVSGSPFDQIIRHAEQFDVNVILVGSTGITNGEKGRLGITAERVVRKSSKPVWVVRQGCVPEVKRILCPVDFSDPSRRALENAIHLARNLETELTVLHVIPMLSRIYAPLKTLCSGKEADWMKQCTRQFEVFLQGFDFSAINCSKLARQGNSPQEVLAAAAEIESDLVVMGSVGRSGIGRVFLGGVASKVLRKMPCSVITVKSEQPIRLEVESKEGDIPSHLREGWQLLEKGYAVEAVREFNYCVRSDYHRFEGVWRGLAEAYRRLGDEREAEICEKTVESIRESQEFARIEADIRSHHPLWSKHD